MNPENRVIIRIWGSSSATFKETSQAAVAVSPGAHRQIQTVIEWKGDNVGHVSIEVPRLAKNHQKSYFSFWPAEDGQIITPVTGKFMENYEADVVAENDRAADIIICLYSLDIHKMFTSFAELSQSGDLQWALLPGRGTRRKTNCVGLAAKLLDAGGIIDKGLVKSLDWSSSSFSAIPPDKFIAKMIEAKKNEKANYPITTSYKFLTETNIDRLKLQFGKIPFGCTIS